MASNRNSSEAGHPIGVVATRTGIKQDVLRAWENRYNAVTPFRSDNGRRLYTDEDIERLRLMRRAVEAGRRISDVAGLATKELRELVGQDSAASPRDGYKRKSSSAASLLDRCMEAIENLDGDALREALAEAQLALTKPQLRGDLLGPLMAQIGEGWSEGTLRVAHEHLATEVIKAFIGSIERGGEAGTRGPTLIISTPQGQLHEMGALLASATARDLGWNVVYLGPNLPADEIAAAALQARASAVALSLVYPPADPDTVGQLRRLRELLGPDTPILVGGRVAKSYSDTLDSIRALLTANLPLFQRALKHLPS
jgi:DNA-binding transcriptional MerR regulator/methylmalonyl-CoA mutase cobalamin-binding subunit